ncbi:hypothetical protein [uncultured Desulfuromonas sp.]|uniref:hypothetical protein n=1 Tax=uncultured Desulfuromonas sp. TaxID=181013 RepID=UPI002AAA80C6|nr:hypothetical protein [uncultured Desulfuromonas sp.]
MSLSDRLSDGSPPQKKKKITHDSTPLCSVRYRQWHLQVVYSSHPVEDGYSSSVSPSVPSTDSPPSTVSGSIDDGSTVATSLLIAKIAAETIMIRDDATANLFDSFGAFTVEAQ